MGSLQSSEIGKQEFRFHDFCVRHRVRSSCHVGDAFVVEAPKHVNDRINFPDAREKSVAEALALAGALHQAGDVHEVDDGRSADSGPGNVSQPIKAWIGHRYTTNIWFDGAEGVVGCLRGSCSA